MRIWRRGVKLANFHQQTYITIPTIPVFLNMKRQPETDLNLSVAKQQKLTDEQTTETKLTQEVIEKEEIKPSNVVEKSSDEVKTEEEVKNKEGSENVDGEAKPQRIKLKKKKFAVYFGYNGEKFVGLQLNPGQYTVELVLEEAMFKAGFITKENHKNLKKIGWSRATRTDKGVHAVVNYIAAKLMVEKGKEDVLEDMVSRIQEHCPSDVSIIGLKPVTTSYNAKNHASSREYEYILPLKMLLPKKVDMETFDLKAEENKEVREGILKRCAECCKKFIGTRNYHNYTKKMKATDPASSRYLKDFSVSEVFEVNGLEVVKFQLLGQSFLYHQIRKTIGKIIEVCRNEEDVLEIEKSFMNNAMDIWLAPGDGLLLYKVNFTGYNLKSDIPHKLELSEEEEARAIKFKTELHNFIAEKEISNQIFTNWLVRTEEETAEALRALDE
mmetsp:Transcript_41183/g.47474  ORF Transcript_41183/g.47474 Transcript_41183/m.47474 type:complete len:441 (+) Transcript_41183:27-1349(+)